MPRLFAEPPTPISFGDGISLITTGGSPVYLTLAPGEANAGMTSNGTDTTTTIFQLFDANGNNSGTSAVYEQNVSMQLTSNSFWITLNPSTDGTPYIRNNAPQLLSWELLQFVPVISNQAPYIYSGDTVYLAHTSDGENYVYVMINEDGSASTTSDPEQATLLVIQSASFTPYIPPSNVNAITYNAPVVLAYSDRSYLYMNGGLENAAVLSISSSALQIFSPNSTLNDESANITYGAPIYLNTNSYYVTMNVAAPYGNGYIRNNVTSFTDYQYAPAWEQLYFISANGHNGDLMNYNDQLYLARNALREGNFATEYLTVDQYSNVSTTTDFASAALLTIYTADA